MKKIYVVYVLNTEGGKLYAAADTLQVGENIKAHIERHNAKTCTVCESRAHAEQTAIQWNEDFKNNGTFGY